MPVKGMTRVWNNLAPTLINKASTVVLKRYDKMQCMDAIRRIGFVMKDSSAVFLEVPITAAK